MQKEKIYKIGEKEFKIDIKVKKINIQVKETITYFQSFVLWVMQNQKIDQRTKHNIFLKLNGYISEAWSQYDKIKSEAMSQYDKIDSEAWSQYDKIKSEARSQYQKNLTIKIKEIIKEYHLEFRE